MILYVTAPSPSHSGGSVSAKAVAGTAACIPPGGTSVRAWARRIMAPVAPCEADPRQMGALAPNGRSLAVAMPERSVGTLPTANGASRPPSAALATISGGKVNMARMIPPSNLMMELGRTAAP